MSTIRDVARKAGVAISTVSAVINHSAPTSAEVVARVERAVAEIGYSPQRAAQTLRSGRSRLIGVVVPDITNPHFSALARIVEKECLQAGYMTFVYNTDEDTNHEMRILRMMRMERVAGLILISTRSDARHGRRLKQEIHVPTVLMGSAVSGAPYDFVALDESEAGAIAAGRLLDLGHRRIVVIGGRRSVSSHTLRLQGCRAAFRSRGLKLSEDQIRFANFVADEAYGETRRCMSEAPRPTAIISFSNFMTLGVMRALIDLGRRVPGGGVARRRRRSRMGGRHAPASDAYRAADRGHDPRRDRRSARIDRAPSAIRAAADTVPTCADRARIMRPTRSSDSEWLARFVNSRTSHARMERRGSRNIVLALQ